MALVVNDRVKETTAVVGTGAATLLGATLGFQSFAVIGNGNTTYYCISDQAGANWEVGIGTYTASGTTLARTTVLSSSNADALVTFTAGVKDVFVTYPSSKGLWKDASGNAISLGTPASGTLTNCTLPQLSASTGSTLVGTTNGGTGSVIRTVASKLNDTVSVKDFGAVGDGVTDDTAAIQLALNVGWNVFVPKGTYIVKNLTIKTNSTLFGEKGQSILKLSPSATISDGILKNFTYSTANTDVAITIDSLEFNGNNLFSGAVQTYYEQLVSFWFVTDAQVINCRFTNSQYMGLAINSCTRPLIANNEFDHLGFSGPASVSPISDNAGPALWVSSLNSSDMGALYFNTTYPKITQNHFHDCNWHGMTYNGQDGEISSNTIVDCKEAGIFMPCDSRIWDQSRNIITGNFFKNITLHSVSAHGIEGGSFFTTYSNNVFWNIAGVGIVDNSGNQCCVFDSNVFFGCGQGGGLSASCLALSATVTSQPQSSHVITNNVFDGYGPTMHTNYGIYFTVLSGTSNFANDILIANNTFVTGSFLTGAYYLDNGSLSTGFTILNNINAKDFDPASNPQVTRYTFGSGTYTTPSKVKYILVSIVGGGGGGSGGGTATFGAGGGGGNTTFGSIITASGGGGGPAPYSIGGTGGAWSASAGQTQLSGQGTNGGSGSLTTAGTASSTTGGLGGGSLLGQGGQGGSYINAGNSGVPNTGAGGGGGAGGTAAGTVLAGNGGGGGGYGQVLITNPAASYSYAIGAAGTAGAAGTGALAGAGGAGASGFISITAYFK